MQNRREFIKGTAVFGAMMAAAPTITIAQGAKRVFKVGMIGAGGRCTGAAAQIIEAAKNIGHEVQIVAVCDFFEDRAKGAAKKFGCDESKAYWDSNSYKKVIASDCEIIVTATPPNFRPIHVEAAIKAGKHVFAEKPVAVDGPGVRQFLAATKLAQEKKLSLVAGSQRRHQKGYLLQALALQQGKVGKVLGGAVYWNGTVPWVRNRDGKSNAAYLASNWVNWTEMSGDHIVEQHVHNIDVANWYIGRYPRTAGAFGGRTRRVSGNQYDFFGVDFDYGDGIHIHSQCRQIGGTSGFVGERFRTEEHEISGGGKIQKIGGDAVALDGDKYELNGNVYAIKDGNPYVIEHENLLKSVLGEIPVMNEGETIAMGTACAVIGRISAYTGQTVRMSDILENQNSPFYALVCKPTWQDFESAATAGQDVAMPEYSDDQFPLPGKPWGAK
jgi:predicted dehydrogenase